MASKKITLRAFKIDTKPDVSESSDNTAKSLLDKLKASHTVDERRMPLNDSVDSKEQDLITSFHEGSSSVKCTHCLMMRIVLGNTEKSLTEAILKRSAFNLTDLTETEIEGAKAIYRSHYYFCLSDKYLVTNLSGNKTISSLQAYLCWYLKKLYQLTPVIDSKVITKLSDISLIDFNDNRIYQRDSLDVQNEETVASIAKNYLKNIFTDSMSIDDVILSKYISATLKISINRPKSSDGDEVQRIFGALMKPISELDNVTIHSKSKGTITKGSEVLKIKEVKVEVLDNNLINEPILRQEMEVFIKELENEN